MALIVEDGTIVANAESYISVSDADVYFDSRGVTIWTTLTVTEKEQALRRATDFMMGRYRARWKGGRSHFNQSLDWPRQGVQPEDMTNIGPGYYGFFIGYNVIPIEVKNACAELAFRAAGGPLLADQEQAIIQETVGPITIKYDPFGSPAIKYVQVDAMLAVYLGRGNGAMVKLFRS